MSQGAFLKTCATRGSLNAHGIARLRITNRSTPGNLRSTWLCGGDRQQGHTCFSTTCQDKLVKKSMSCPDIIDAGFPSFVKGWEWQKLSNQTIAANRIPFDDLMKYRAIIDIDGNAWSSRFTKLLCTNSVIIKVCVHIIVIVLHCIL